MPRFGLDPIVGIAIGTLLGGLGQIALQWPFLRKEGFRYQPIVDFRDPAVREILRLMAPATVGLAAVQINVFVNTHLATGQEQGAVSWLQYAFRLMYLPIGIFGVSIATASLPEISRHAVTEDLKAIRESVSRALRMMLMLNVPATVGLMVLAHPIVALIYEREMFHAGDTTATAAALVFYAPGLLGYSAVKIASPTFYSLRDSRTPVVVSVISVGVNLGINLVAHPRHGLSRARVGYRARRDVQRRCAALASQRAARGDRGPARHRRPAEGRRRVGCDGRRRTRHRPLDYRDDACRR